MNNLISFSPTKINGNIHINKEFFPDQVRSKDISILLKKQLKPIHNRFICKRTNTKVPFRYEQNMSNSIRDDPQFQVHCYKKDREY